MLAIFSLVLFIVLILWISPFIIALVAVLFCLLMGFLTWVWELFTSTEKN